MKARLSGPRSIGKSESPRGYVFLRGIFISESDASLRPQVMRRVHMTLFIAVVPANLLSSALGLVSSEFKPLGCCLPGR